ncbi:MAG TPA: 3-isopropylmalate dehydratase small subunit [Vicinamibacterales bacterium]|nr:3-isopropylmalate dehydratase small subunit [Vicinamibacterales bacterium]
MAGERIRVVTGTAVPLRGDDIDTDRIIPARFLKSITFDGLEQHLFEDDRREAASRAHAHPFSNPAYARASVLLVNANFGCGSSREHAPQAIQRRGIRAIVGQSFSDIFFGNAVALGVPCLTAARETLDALMTIAERDPGAVFDVDVEAKAIRAADRTFPLELGAAARESFLDGSWDATGLLLDRFDEVQRVAARLPYVDSFA